MNRQPSGRDARTPRMPCRSLSHAAGSWLVSCPRDSLPNLGTLAPLAALLLLDVFPNTTSSSRLARGAAGLRPLATGLWDRTLASECREFLELRPRSPRVDGIARERDAAGEIGGRARHDERRRRVESDDVARG